MGLPKRPKRTPRGERFYEKPEVPLAPGRLSRCVMCRQTTIYVSDPDGTTRWSHWKPGIDSNHRVVAPDDTPKERPS